MQAMFNSASAFNANISSWDTSSVTTMRYMFSEAAAFNADITSWDTSSATNLNWMFSYASAWGESYTRVDGTSSTDGPPSAWKSIRLPSPPLGLPPSSSFSNRAELSTAVENCLAVNATGVACCASADCGPAGSTEMPGWDVSSVTEMNNLFDFKSAFHANISGWDTSSVTTMAMMFCASYRNRVIPKLYVCFGRRRTDL